MMTIIKRGFLAMFLLLFVLTFSAPIYAGEVLFNSTYSSGETLTIGQNTYTLSINYRNNDVRILKNGNTAYFLSYFEDTVIDNYVFEHAGTVKSGTSLQNESLWGNPGQNLQTRVRLIVSRYEPELTYDWSVDFDELLVGEEATYELIIRNTGDSVANDVVFEYSLPEKFVLTDISKCKYVDDSIVFETVLQKDSVFRCSYSGIMFESAQSTTAIAKLRFVTEFENVTLYPELSLPAILDPFTIRFDTNETINKTAVVGLAINISSDISSKILLRDIELLVPNTHFTVDRSDFVSRSSPNIPSLGIVGNYTSYYKSLDSIKGVDDSEQYDFRFVADVRGYVPVYFSFRYEFEGDEYIYGYKKLYYNISQFSQSSQYLIPDSPLEFELTLSNTSSSLLSTLSTATENMHVRIKSECDCEVTNITFVGTVFNKTVMNQTRTSLASGGTFFVSSLKNYMPFVLSDTSFTFSGSATYFVGNKSFQANITESILVKAPSQTVVTKVVSPTSAEVSDVVNVTVYISSGFLGQNISVHLSEDLDYLTDHFSIIGPTSRILTPESDEKIVAYQYQLIPLQVSNKTVFDLNTTFTADYFPYLLQEEVRVNSSFSPTNQTHIDALRVRLFNDSSYVYNETITKTVTVSPRVFELAIDVSDLSEVVLGDIIQARVTFSNNGTSELDNVTFVPITTDSFQAVRGQKYVLPKLLPGEERTTLFKYRLISQNKTQIGLDSLLNVSYITLLGVPITFQETYQVIDTIVPSANIPVLTEVITINSTSSLSRHSITSSSTTRSPIRIYFTNGTVSQGEVTKDAPYVFDLSSSITSPDVVHVYDAEELILSSRAVNVTQTTFALDDDGIDADNRSTIDTTIDTSQSVVNLESSDESFLQKYKTLFLYSVILLVVLGIFVFMVVRIMRKKKSSSQISSFGAHLKASQIATSPKKGGFGFFKPKDAPPFRKNESPKLNSVPTYSPKIQTTLSSKSQSATGSTLRTPRVSSRLNTQMDLQENSSSVHKSTNLSELKARLSAHRQSIASLKQPFNK